MMSSEFDKMKASVRAAEESKEDDDSELMDCEDEDVEIDDEDTVTVGDGSYAGYRKYPEYKIDVDPDQDDKATEIKLCSFARPHMRAFHCSWWGFFIAFFIWFAIAPLLSEIREDLNLTKQEVWTSSIVGVGGTIMMRFILGPLCDKWGARILFTIVLCAASIPTALTGAVNSATGLAIIRLFIGTAGGTFVMCQYWSSRMFTKKVVGTANALVGGWGNLGGGVTQLVMGSALFPMFKAIYGGDSEKAWRTVSVIPAVVAFASGVGIYFIADDAPRGNYSDLKKHGAMPEVSAAASFRSGALNFNTWFLFIQYACCFGVELTMNNASALYFKDAFGQSTESAAAIASIFGWMNLFARGLGGYCSDKANSRWGMRGRIWVQTINLVVEGALVLVFANTQSLGAAIFVMVVFSVFVQAAEGSSYGIVPYVDPPSTGSIAGIVGAGGNTGAVCFGLGFRQLDYKAAFIIMGATILGSSFLSIFINIKGYSGLLWGKDTIEKNITVEEDEEAKAAKEAAKLPDTDEEKITKLRNTNKILMYFVGLFVALTIVFGALYGQEKSNGNSAAPAAAADPTVASADETSTAASSENELAPFPSDTTFYWTVTGVELVAGLPATMRSEFAGPVSSPYMSGFPYVGDNFTEAHYVAWNEVVGSANATSLLFLNVTSLASVDDFCGGRSKLDFDGGFWLCVPNL